MKKEMASMKQWFGKNDTTIADKDAVIEQLRKDLYEAHKQTSIWKHKAEELETLFQDFANLVVAANGMTDKNN